MGEGSGRSPPRPRPRPGRPSLGRSDCNRRDPVFCEPLADHTRPVQRVAPMPAAPATSPPPSRRRGDVHPAGPPRGPPRPRGPVPYQLGGEPGRPSGIEKSRHWEVLGEGGAGLKGTTTSFHWGSGGTEEVPKLERNGKNVKLLRSFWLAPLFPLILSPTFHLNQEKKSPSCLWFTWQFSPFAECF